MAALAGGEEGDAGGEPPAFLHLRALRIFGQGKDKDEMATRNRNAAAAPPLHHRNRGEPMDLLSSWLLPPRFLAQGQILGDLGND